MNTKSTLQKSLSHSMENPISRKPADRTKTLWSTDDDNVRGAWITRYEIHKLRNNASREIENERNTQQDEFNNADVAIEGENAGLPHNIIPPEENAIEQPNEINENELLKIKKTLVNAYAKSIVTPFDKRFNLRKPGRKIIKKLEDSLEKVNDVIEATPLLTEKTTSQVWVNLLTLQQLLRLKLRVSKMSVPSKKDTSIAEKEIGHSIWMANKWASRRYQQNITNERSNTFTKTKKKYELEENKIPNCRRASIIIIIIIIIIIYLFNVDKKS